MKIMVTSFKMSHTCTAALSAPDPAARHRWPTPPLETPEHSRASLGQSLVESLHLSPGSWCMRFCLPPPRAYFPAMCKLWRLYDGVNGDLPQEGLCHTPVGYTQSPCPCSSPQETLKHSSVSVSVGSLGPGAHKICLSPLSVSGRYGFDSKCNFTPPSVLLWHLLFPWMWGISSKLLQRCTAAAPAPTILLGLLCFWTMKYT